MPGGLSFVLVLDHMWRMLSYSKLAYIASSDHSLLV